MDKDTQQILTDAEEIQAMTTGKGWELVKGKLEARILDLQNINNLDIEKPETLATQLIARKMAVDEIWLWLKLDVYGAIEAKDAAFPVKQEGESSFIDRE